MTQKPRKKKSTEFSVTWKWAGRNFIISRKFRYVSVQKEKSQRPSTLDLHKTPTLKSWDFSTTNQPQLVQVFRGFKNIQVFLHLDIGIFAGNTTPKIRPKTHKKKRTPTHPIKQWWPQDVSRWPQKLNSSCWACHKFHGWFFPWIFSGRKFYSSCAGMVFWDW